VRAPFSSPKAPSQSLCLPTSSLFASIPQSICLFFLLAIPVFRSGLKQTESVQSSVPALVGRHSEKVGSVEQLRSQQFAGPASFYPRYQHTHLPPSSILNHFTKDDKIQSELVTIIVEDNPVLLPTFHSLLVPTFRFGKDPYATTIQPSSNNATPFHLIQDRWQVSKASLTPCTPYTYSASLASSFTE